MEGTDEASSQPISSSSPTDMMNDSQFTTNQSGDDGTGDADTCRICRGEATEQEPLFYPCKCSGSIKFVHQDCLMEWLSHSQKKHCELCKTPFRFTKLYSPNMPPSLPIPVFIRHLIVHGVKNFAIWLRACLVAFVWLGCLPWTMRHIWGFLFWFGDGGWTMKTSGTVNYVEPAYQALSFAQDQLANLAANGTSPATPLLSKPTTSATIWKLPSFLKPFSQTLNLSVTDPLAAGLFKSIYHGLGFSSLPTHGNTLSSSNASRLLDGHRLAMAERSSLLSDIQFLKALTRNPRFNNIVITTLEGQIITIVVVVCFVLVFLIREWVVQQQPGINMGAGFNAEIPGADRGPRPRNNGILDDDIDAGDRPANEVDARREARDDIVRFRAADNIAARPIARPRRRIHFQDGQHDRGTTESSATVGGEMTGPNGEDSADNFSGGGSLQNQMLTGQSQVALKPQQPLAGDQTPSQDNLNGAEFVSVWRRADGNPEEVLRIIEEEGLSAKLGYWKNAIKSLQQANAAAASNTGECGTDDGFEVPNTIGSDDADSKTSGTSEPVKERQPDRSSHVIRRDHDLFGSKARVTDITTGKGKEKATEERSEPLFDPNFGALPGLGLPTFGHGYPILSRGDEASNAAQAYPSRPRATSDGPSLRENISPLANNSWSFSELPSDSPSVVPEHTESSVDDVQEPNLYPESASHRTADHGTSDLLADNTREPVPLSNGNDETHIGPIEVISNGESIVADSWDDIFANNPLSDSEDETEDDSHAQAGNPFHPDGLLPEADLLPEHHDRHPVVPRIDEPQGFWGFIAEWLWGDMDVDREREDRDDEHIVRDIAAEAPFVPVAHLNGNDPFLAINGEIPEQINGNDAVAAALAAGVDQNDPDGLEDAEDFEGIMELVGMRGPLTGLVQNGLFSAVLISLTVACGVWIPYNIGRLTLLLIANPVPAIKLPLKLLFSLAAILQDLSLVIIGCMSYLFVKIWFLPQLVIESTFYRPALASQALASHGSGPALECLRIAYTAGERIVDGFMNAIIHIPESEVPAFSAVSHDALLYIKAIIARSLTFVGSSIVTVLTSREYYEGFINAMTSFPKIKQFMTTAAKFTMQGIRMLPGILARSESWVISLDYGEQPSLTEPNFSYWTGADRFWAILAGYVTISLLGAAYLRRGSPFSTGQTGREWEATIIDILNQAGGVMKVILIISIEMLVFPLYCGLLLDIALLPLFENASLSSRVLFTVDTPLTSVFVHWFVGTCYMFHFALFVSMCRKIMRSGVLYFIRDPDDPTFHPVRDVLERNVATQLRKITFSAMVYGALVVICLGGVVWSLAFAFPGVLPIHWSSNEPVLEFPIDLLFYNFFMPLAVKFFKPSDGLHAMYAWWFRKCARILRLTWFLFDERLKDEEGHHVHRTWQDFLSNVKGDVDHPVKRGQVQDPFRDNPDLNAYFIQDGKYVRTPASDQVRIPKGEKVFLEVTEDNKRVDDALDPSDGLHGSKSDLFKMVYIPPRFRFRIFLLILFIWLFAAVTGVCITILPLVFGRHIFARIIPEHIRKNDVYAFSIGIYILGSSFYAILHIKDGLQYLRNSAAINSETSAKIIRKATNLSLWVLRLIYAYTAFALVLPTLFSFLIEFYFIVPLHTYFAPNEPHVIQFVQSWTLGLLYVKLTSRLILWHADSRPAEALRAVTRKGYLDPDIRIATRCFILPATIVLSLALLIPFCLAWVVNTFDIFGHDAFQQMLVYRHAYPLCLSMLINACGAWVLMGVLKGWRMKIRDEVYLIGERLHNFGDKSKSGANGLLPSSNRIDT